MLAAEAAIYLPRNSEENYFFVCNFSLDIFCGGGGAAAAAGAT